MKNINLNNINVNNSVAHLEALLKNREELAKKLAAIDEEIKEIRKTIEVKQAVVKLQKEYADKAAALKKEYDAKIKALVGDDNTSTPDPQPESPKPAPKAQPKETTAPKAAPVAKKAEEKKPAQAPAARAEAKPTEAPKAAPAPKKVVSSKPASSQKKTVEARSVVKVTADNYQQVINSVDKAKAASTIMTADFSGDEAEFMMLVKAAVYAFQNGIAKTELVYHDPAAVERCSKEIALLLKYAQTYGISVSIRESHRGAAKKSTVAPKAAPAPKTEEAPKVKAQGTNPAKADNTATEEETSDAFRAWTLSQACVVDGDDEI